MRRGAVKKKFPIQDFKERADSAAFWEAWVGAVLARSGLYTVHHPFTVAENWKEAREHYLTWDLTVCNYEPEAYNSSASGLDKRPVEIKSLNLEFYGPEDYPFDVVMVCSQKSWDRKWPGTDKTSRDFIFVSRATGALVWLPVGSPVMVNVPAVDRERGDIYSGVRTEKKYLRDLAAFVQTFKGGRK